MAVQFINVESFVFLRKFVGTKNPLSMPVLPILCFCAGAQKNMAAKFKGPLSEGKLAQIKPRSILSQF